MDLERLEMAREAKKRLEEVVDLVQMAVEGTEHENYYDAYFVGNVRDFIDGRHQSGNLAELIEELKKE